MIDLIICLRALQLYAHAAHNLAKHAVFFQDHEFLSEIYNTAEEDYDSVVERMIGIMGPESLDLKQITMTAASKMAQMPLDVKNNAEVLSAILSEEIYVCSHIENFVRSGNLTVGFEQLLGDIANKSEMRQYKLKQRLRQ